MTPKEKEDELVNKFKKLNNISFSILKKEVLENVAKQCALIAIDEIYKNNTDESKNDYWIEVKKELEEMK